MTTILHKLKVASRIARKRLFSFAGKWNEKLQPAENFCIKQGYHHSKKVEQFDDTIFTDEWQREVYLKAADLIRKNSFRSVIDVGCGSAYKLVHILGEFDTTGIEIEPTYSWLQKKYPQRKWLLFDNTNPSEMNGHVVICSDVIEHISNPDQLMKFLASINFQKLIITTPERDLVAGKKDFGPPRNTAHYREWNADEFRNYVSIWFYVEQQIILNDKSITQMLICNKLSLQS